MVLSCSCIIQIMTVAIYCIPFRYPHSPVHFPLSLYRRRSEAPFRPLRLHAARVCLLDDIHSSLKTHPTQSLPLHDGEKKHVQARSNASSLIVHFRFTLLLLSTFVMHLPSSSSHITTCDFPMHSFESHIVHFHAQSSASASNRRRFFALLYST